MGIVGVIMLNLRHHLQFEKLWKVVDDGENDNGKNIDS